MPKNVQNAYSGPWWDMRKYFKGRTPPSLFSSYKSGIVGGFSHWLSLKIVLYWSHIAPSLSYSKNSVLLRFYENHAFTPRQRSKFLTDENFCNMVIWYIIGTAIKWYISVLTQWIGIINFSHISMAYWEGFKINWAILGSNWKGFKASWKDLGTSR